MNLPSSYSSGRVGVAYLTRALHVCNAITGEFLLSLWKRSRQRRLKYVYSQRNGLPSRTRIATSHSHWTASMWQINHCKTLSFVQPPPQQIWSHTSLILPLDGIVLWLLLDLDRIAGITTVLCVWLISGMITQSLTPLAFLMVIVHSHKY